MYVFVCVYWMCVCVLIVFDDVFLGQDLVVESSVTKHPMHIHMQCMREASELLLLPLLHSQLHRHKAHRHCSAPDACVPSITTCDYSGDKMAARHTHTDGEKEEEETRGRG